MYIKSGWLDLGWEHQQWILYKSHIHVVHNVCVMHQADVEPTDKNRRKYRNLLMAIKLMGGEKINRAQSSNGMCYELCGHE